MFVHFYSGFLIQVVIMMKTAYIRVVGLVVEK